MDCISVRNLMSSYIDKDMNEIDRIEFEKHLENCPDCMEEYNLLLSTVAYCNQLEEIELPETFHEELMSKIKTSGNNKKKKFFDGKWRWATGVAAVIVVAFIGLFALKGLPGYNMSDKSFAKEEAAGESSEIEYSSKQSIPAMPAAEPTSEERGIMNFSESLDVDLSAQSKSEYALTLEASGESTSKEKSVKTSSEGEIYERKIITSGSISLEVTDFDEKMESIAHLAEKSGGYVENSYVDNVINHTEDENSQKLKTGSITLRLPAAKYKSVVDEVKTMGEVVNENTNSVDISEQYYDTSARIDNLKVQENRLRELVSMADKVDDILKIENELNRVRSEIELMSTNIKRWDKQVSLSTLYINLKEVKERKLEGVNIPSFWGKAYNGFVGTLNSILNGTERLFIFIISVIPYLIIVGILSAIGYGVYKKKIKPKKIQ